MLILSQQLQIGVIWKSAQTIVLKRPAFLLTKVGTQTTTPALPRPPDRKKSVFSPVALFMPFLDAIFDQATLVLT